MARTRFTLEQKLFIIKLYIRSGHRIELVKEKCLEKYGRKPATSTIQALYRKFETTGSIQNRKRTEKPRKKTLYYLEILEECCDKVMTQNEMVDHFAKHNVKIGRRWISKLHKKSHIRSYVVKRMLHLTDDNLAAREKFSEWAMAQLKDDPDFLYRVIFTDEAAFPLYNDITKTGKKYYGRSAPNFGHPHKHFSPKLHVFVALNIMYGVIFYEFFITDEGKLTTISGPNYEALMHNFKLATRKINLNELWWMQDGASPHIYGPAKKIIKELFDTRIIGRGFDNVWPSKSPDLNCLDYFFWGRLRKLVNLLNFCDLNTATKMLTEAIENFNVQEIINAILGFKSRVQMCGTLKGRPVRGPMFRMNEVNSNK